uniref:hypothetical protein n=1 Tax=uncultured Flavonifractor sp. TaxID=1193534 RepID=UPI00262F2D83
MEPEKGFQTSLVALFLVCEAKEKARRNRKISRRIKRPPSQRTGNEMAVGIFIMVLEFYISGAHSPGGKIPPKPHPSGSGPV